MIHVVFNQADVLVLEQVVELDNTLHGKIVQIKDDYAVGPIVDIYETYGYQNRRDWWQNVLTHSPYTEQLNIVDDKLVVHQLQQLLASDSTQEIWIWMGQNAHDVCGYYWLLPQLKNYQGKIQILYLNNLPFINEKGNIFYPSHLHQIQPSEFLKAKKLARPITLSEFEIDPDEWKKLGSDNAYIRLLEGGKKLVSKEEGYFDGIILSGLTNEFQKLTKIIQNILGKLKIQIGDAFLVYRIKELIGQQKIEKTGNWEKGWKDVEVRLVE